MVPTINEHIKKIYADSELEESATIRNFRIVQTEGSRQVTRDTKHYNLQMIIAVGFKVNSERAVQFRKWANLELEESAKKWRSIRCVDRKINRRCDMSEKLKVLIINGSPRVGGNTSIALREMETVFEQNGVETECVQIGSKPVRGCIACNYCVEHDKCVFDDEVNTLAEKFKAADGLVLASPVYFASANATLVACLDRLFYSTSFDKTMKVGAAVVAARTAAAARQHLMS